MITASRTNANSSVSKIVLTLACFVAAPILLPAQENWPQWRGPNRTDISDASGTLDQWPSDGPKQLWVSDKAGLGYSGFAIVDDILYTMGEEDGSQFVIAIDTKSSSVKWSHKTGPGYVNGWGDGPRSTPTYDDGNIYALDANGILVCLEAANGSEKWRQDLRDFGGTIPQWGYSESVLVDGDKVVCTPGGKQGAVIAFDKSSGKKLWQMKGNTEVAHYSSIVKAEVNGEPQYIQLMAKKLLGISPDGKLLWQSDWPGRIAVIPTPIVKDNFVYITSGYGVGSKKIKVSEGNKVENVWTNRVMKNHHGGAILLDGHVYGYSDSVGWVCQDFETGEITWRHDKSERSGGLGKGAIGYADGKFICVSEQTGAVVMIDATSDGWNEKGRFTLKPQTSRRKPRGMIWVHPVVVNGKLFLRDQEYIYCYDVEAD